MKTESGSRIDQAGTLSELTAVLDERFRYYNRGEDTPRQTTFHP